ncbi:MAG: hypothetical protein E7354_05540 [Clostridiales bacterium]|nr:hypothetical protein [Clostridiales bacterium]
MWFYLLFFVCQLVNVVLSTIKSVITIKGTKLMAYIFSAVNYGFNTYIIKVIADVELYVAVIVSVICNLLGVYLGMLITDKMRKEQLWKITVTVPTEKMTEFKKELCENKIDFIAYETSWNDYKVVDVFSKHKSTSKTIKHIFSNYDVKYTISANVGEL